MVDTIKYDCFACKEKNGEKVCDALDKLYCKKEDCSFYKDKQHMNKSHIESAIRNYSGSKK